MSNPFQGSECSLTVTNMYVDLSEDLVQPVTVYQSPYVLKDFQHFAPIRSDWI